MFEKDVLFNLIKETNTNEEIRILVNMLDRLWREDKVKLTEDDWPILVKIISEAKTRNDKNARN